MKFRAERDALAEVLATAGRAVIANRSARPSAVEGIRLEVRGDQLEAVGTDYEMTIRTTSPVKGREDGVCVAPARLLADAVKAVEAGAVDIESADDEIRISSGRTNYNLRTFSVDEFPKFSEVTGEAVILDTTDLSDALHQVVRAASSDDARPVFTGVLMTSEGTGLRLVATDAYRLARRDLPGTTFLSEGQQVLVPSKSLSELARILSGSTKIKLQLGEHDVTFEVGPPEDKPDGSTTRITARLLAGVGQFPKYSQLFPENAPNKLYVSRDALLDALRRVKILVRDLATNVHLNLRADGLELTVVNKEVGRVSEDIEARYEGVEMGIRFNPAYLLEGVEAVVGDEVVLETTDAVKAAVIHGTDSKDFLYLLMPTRL